MSVDILLLNDFYCFGGLIMFDLGGVFDSWEGLVLNVIMARGFTVI